MIALHSPMVASVSDGLIGIGLYTPAEAGRLIQVSPTRLGRWLAGHTVGERHYERLWRPQIDFPGEGVFLGFRDLQEARVTAAFIDMGLSAQRVRQAIGLARDLLGEERPLSTNRFKTDGRSVFLDVVEQDGQVRLLDLLREQYAFRAIVDRSLKDLEFDKEGSPARWWPLGRARSIVVDPARSFGQPIEAETAVPAAALAAAALAQGSVSEAARAWDVPPRAIRRAVVFADEMSRRSHS